MTTETVLRDWRFGQAQAERLVAALLYLEGFENIDPQHPLGGPDGLKDVLCKKDGVSWIAAAYFPTSHVSAKKIEGKFRHDLDGVEENGAKALAFFVNQPLAIGVREKLLSISGDARVEIYHLERIRGLLDAPKGCGIRLEYLRIPMSEEEQWAFWSSMNQDVIRRLVDNESRRETQMKSVEDKLEMLLERTRALSVDLLRSASSLSPSEDNVSESIEMPTASLSLTTLCWLHRLVSEGTGLVEAVRGRFRSVRVWIGPATSTPETATFVPSPPEEVVNHTQKLISWWRAEHVRLRSAPKQEIIAKLAVFHYRFLEIHPFLDANGRVARSLLDQAARELLNQSIGIEFTEDAQGYFQTLTAANRGDLAPLVSRISAALR